MRGGRDVCGDGGDGGGGWVWVIAKYIPAACDVQTPTISKINYEVEGREIYMTWRGTEVDDSKLFNLRVTYRCPIVHISKINYEVEQKKTDIT